MISLVVPVLDEQDSLSTLLDEITSVMGKSELACEAIFVDDGSRDESWRIIAELASAHEWVCGIRLRRNFGKAAALSAGFRAARGEVILTLDADLQDDPAEIPRFLPRSLTTKMWSVAGSDSGTTPGTRLFPAESSTISSVGSLE